MAYQTTLKNSISCSGIGLHSGVRVQMALHPAEADSGITFRRTDIDRKIATVPARYDLVSDTTLGTTIRNKHGVIVSTVEHVMAALWGMGVDNAVIDIEGPEVPIMDGSSEPFVVLIQEAGITKLAAPRKVIRVLREVEVAAGGSTASVQPYPGEDFACALELTIDYKHPVVSLQHKIYDFSDVTFSHMLASARTFAFEHEVDAIRKAGLGQGGSLDNAIVVGKEGVLNPEGLRYSDEFIRHKALDCTGDLFLAGHRIEGYFTFEKPGHTINNKLLRALMADKRAWKLVSTQEPAPQQLRYVEEPAYA